MLFTGQESPGESLYILQLDFHRNPGYYIIKAREISNVAFCDGFIFIIVIF